MSSKVIMRDSGEDITRAFLQSCIKEKTEIFVKYECDDFVNTVKVGQLDKDHLILLGDGVSVENRELYKITSSGVEYQDFNLEIVVTEKDVANLLNTSFQTKEYSEEGIKRIAHSHFRAKLPRRNGESIVITSGYLSNREHGYKPIGTLIWDGKKFILKK